jgi:hypothetical protein
MTNLQLAKLYLAITTPTPTAAEIDTAVTTNLVATTATITALSAADFLEASYQAAFGRSVDADGTAAYLTKLTDGTLTKDAFAAILVAGAAIYPADGAFVTTAAKDVTVAAAKAVVEATDTTVIGATAVAAATIIATTADVAAAQTAAVATVTAVHTFT